uniref:Uncharacterized protein n=1 Tax=Anolis carolinensis TaxID=28377 RepID=A0A803TDH5_ANOCA
MGDGGTYGAAKVGSPSDLWHFLQQPQVLARLLSAVSQDSGWAVSGPRLQSTNNHTQRPESI